jgi:hypothetical protein
MFRLNLASILLLQVLTSTPPTVSYHLAENQSRNAQTDGVVYRLPGMERIKPLQETYENVDGEPLALHLYQAPGMKQGERRPAVIFVNSKRPSMPTWQFYISWGQLVAASGLNAILYQSSVNPDVELDKVVSYARKNAARFQIDENRIGVMTMSGNTVTALPYMTQRNREYIRCGVIYYGMIEAPRVRNDLPLFIVRAGLETNRELNQKLEEYVRSLVENNSPVTYVNLTNGHHSFDLVDDNQQSRAVIADTLTFLERNLR